MKSLISKLILIFALLPGALYADIKSDMANSKLTLVEVLQNAMTSGMSVTDAVTQMIGVNPKQADAIVASAIVTSPNSAAAIVAAAIKAGADPAGVVMVAIVATNGADASEIEQAALNAAPAGASAAIESAYSNALAETTGGPGAPGAGGHPAGGGGAQATPSTIKTVLTERQALFAQIGVIRDQLTAGGYTSGSLTSALNTLETALRDQGAPLSYIAQALNTLSQEIASGTLSTNQILAGINNAIASASGGAPVI